MFKCHSELVTIICLIVLFLLTSFANSQNITGNMEGRITDNFAAPISGVNISIHSENLQGVRGTATDDKGVFRIFNLPLGSYTVKVSCIGFREVTIGNVLIRLGKTTRLSDVKLEQQAITLPEITISDKRQIIDPTSTTYGGNLRSKDFAQLPIDRNYKSIVTLLPQANTSYYGDEANIGGATGNENKYYVDGIEVTDPLIGANATNLPYNFI